MSRIFTLIVLRNRIASRKAAYIVLHRFKEGIRSSLPLPMDERLFNRTIQLTDANSTFPRILNRDLSPPSDMPVFLLLMVPLGILFISGIPHAMDTYRQFTIGCSLSVRTNPLPMSRSNYYWQYRILSTQRSFLLAGRISPIAISTSEKLGLILSSGSPQLCSLSPLEARPQCHNIGHMSSTTRRLSIDI
jgi:hypothetical protein